MRDLLSLAIFISGGGTTMERILLEHKQGNLPGIEPALIISSSFRAGGIQKALNQGFSSDDIVVLPRSAFNSNEARGEAILKECQKRVIDFISQNGWLALTPPNIIAEYRGRIFNQHPGPLDYGRAGFGGQGMIGRAVHYAVVSFAHRVNREFCSAATVHKVVEECDAGPVIGMSEEKVLQTDTELLLQERLLPKEHALVISVVQCIAATGRLPEVQERGELLVREHEELLLAEAKLAARSLYPKG